eukprot:TRINITY_DN16736_c0_g1_i2.p1 TRINITY_DN16736_c0_g1~~TRINITY_DN16736_c0_g1_i2.p1  ORF type:complete len:452 (+),score=50.03 TRINITY_DN16736_c0_g1_i2:110-1465(+)
MACESTVAASADSLADSPQVKSRPDLRLLKLNAPWRRRSLVGSPPDSAADPVAGEDVASVADKKLTQASKWKFDAEVEAQNWFALQRPPCGSDETLFVRNTFVEVGRDTNFDTSSDGGGSMSYVPQRPRANSDSCVDYRFGEATACNDGCEETTWNNYISNSEFCSAWFAHVEGDREFMLSYQPFSIMPAGHGTSVAETGSSEWQAEPQDFQAAINSAQAAVNLEAFYQFVYPGEYYDEEPENISYLTTGSHESQEQRWTRASSFAPSVDSTTASSGDVSSTGKTQNANIILRNIPIWYQRDTFLKTLDDEGFESCYDFVYLPIDFESGNSRGYGFVNMVTEHEADRLVAHFQGYTRWKVASRKVCETERGAEGTDLYWYIERYRNSSVMHPCVPSHYKPMMFRDGVEVPFPPPTRTIRMPWTRKQACELQIPLTPPTGTTTCAVEEHAGL